MFSYAIAYAVPLAIAGGALGALTIEHGWGWVVAKIKAWRARATSQAGDLYFEMQGQVKAEVDRRFGDAAAAADLVKTFADRLTSIEQVVATVRAKVGV
jgi:hypothetical protein